MAGQKKQRGRTPIAAFFGFGLSNPGVQPHKNKKKPTPSRAVSSPSGDTDTQVPVAAHSFSSHFITFALIIAIIAVSIYGPLSSFLKQRDEINDAKETIAALEAEQDALEAQVSWWEDDNYVKQQARSRLFYVEPGQTPYLVVGLDGTSALIDDTSAAAKTAPEDPWTTKLWGSFQLASGQDAPAVGAGSEAEETDSSDAPSPDLSVTPSE